MSDPFAARRRRRRRTAPVARASPRHDVAVVLGSGWRLAADLGGLSGTEIALADLPGIPRPIGLGHGRTVRSVDVDGRRVLVFLGRIHLYEGHDPNVVAHGVRTAAAAGCRTVVLTNGAGSLRRGVADRTARADQRPHQPDRPLAA